ncbi:PREDICTED: DNA (cytosine-5)-methyltransferase CMT3-like [Ipomoea nil]|uniref:DNA (cytosine-5)-methyltransferase CMT3-like n=1 Tax=Ipomoea nil TaxID=35883 RepID=UPI000901A416|nr:PREDICTED: DNA (cytosine-5)-methyltransferase CMT3-like [Ipomoea nil]
MCITTSAKAFQNSLIWNTFNDNRICLLALFILQKLPQYPLPTHNVVVRGVIPTEFELNTVAYDEGHGANLKKELFLGDAISDLPPVENNEKRDDMEYVDKPGSEFQQFIRLGRDGLPGTLHDHCPLQLNDDDYQRVCHIPKAKVSKIL